MWTSEHQLQTIMQRCEGVALRLQEPLSRHTSFRIGGPAAVMAFPKNESELRLLLKCAAEENIRPYLLGAGTNILAPDPGVQALVICLKDTLTGIRLIDETAIEVYAGESLAKAAVFAKNQALSGLEFAHGIPGTLGGGIYMNAGAYGGEMSRIVESVTILTMDAEEQTLSAAESAFAYRTSVYQQLPCVIVRAVLRLEQGDPEKIGEQMRQLMEKRRASQPLELPSAGSTFKRPEGFYAGTLIEQAGLKGKGVGGAAVSGKHAGFVVNTGGATAADVLATIAMVQQRVHEYAGVTLEPEIRIW